MLKKALKIFILTAITTTAMSAETLSFKDNADLSVKLSLNNYNRLLVQGDKIIGAYFPENAMVARSDEGDGSLYVIPKATAPFNVFLTTESGHHFSVVINSEEALGKTIELIPLQKNTAPLKKTTEKREEPQNKAVETQLISFIQQMEQGQVPAGFTKKRHFGKANRLSQTLVLIPKETWSSKDVTGEIIEVYNQGKTPLNLSQEWFSKEDVTALKLSQQMILPNQKALLYRVRGTLHG